MTLSLVKLNQHVTENSRKNDGDTLVIDLIKSEEKHFQYFESITTPIYPMQTWNWACQFWCMEKLPFKDHQAYLISISDADSGAWIQSIVYQYPWHFNQVFLTIPRGPINSDNFFSVNPEIQDGLVQKWIEALQQLVSDTKAVYVRIESTWDNGQEINLKTGESEKEVAELKYLLGQKIQSSLPADRINKDVKFLQTPYSRTISVWEGDLLLAADPNLDQDFAIYSDKYFEGVIQSFESKTRYNARLGKKKGLTVKWSKTDEFFQHFWKVMQETSQRQHFVPYRREYYYNVFQNKWADLALVFTPEGEVTNAWMGSFIAGMGMYLYGGSRVEFGALKGAELIHTSAIIRTIQAGYKYYDMGGTSLLDGAIPGWDGYSKFKKGFGGKIVDYLPHTYDYVVRPRIYQAVNLAVETAKRTRSIIPR
ncbi:MAG: hypothetical protein OHK0017_00050 [Patescibacteria group bacterium]